MKKILTILIFLTVNSLLFTAYCQNLVPNPSFEEYYSCPDNQCQIYHATGWLPMGFTPDYFNACSINMGVPDNAGGFQYAATGNAYAGIGINIFPPYIGCRDFIGIKLLDSIQPGKTYKVSFKANLCDKSRYGINKLGILFTTKSLETIPYYCNTLPNDTTVIINNFSHVSSDSMILDNENWTEISGTLVRADSAYKYIVIGNFYDENHIRDSLINTAGIQDAVYYYIDDVSVIKDSTENINENLAEYNQLMIYPNPAKDILQYSIPFYIGPYQIEILDISGKSISNKYFTVSEKQEIDLSYLDEGFYFIKFTYNHKYIVKKLIIIK